MNESFITAQSELDAAVEAVRSAGRMGFDTEFMREKTYAARLCLVQMAAADSIYLIDPLERLDLTGVAQLIADADVEVVVHAGRQDFEILYQRYGLVPDNVFDVQVAAGFAGFGASLPYGRLIEAVVGTSIVKGESYTDWCTRPLTKAQIRYAAEDVRYLDAASERLRRKLTTMDRIEWALDEMASFSRAESYEVDLDAAWRKVAGRGNLPNRHVPVLAELAKWREQAAARRDLPRGWLVKDVTLVEIARRQPGTTAELARVRGMNAKEAERSGTEILAAIARGRRNPAEPVAPGPDRAALQKARTLVGLADAVVRARCESAGIATELVATRGDLEALLGAVADGSAEPSEHRLLRGWRRELAGDAVVALARGRVAVRVTDEPPYLEEVPLPDEGSPRNGASV